MLVYVTLEPSETKTATVFLWTITHKCSLGSEEDDERPINRGMQRNTLTHNLLGVSMPLRSGPFVSLGSVFWNDLFLRAAQLHAGFFRVRRREMHLWRDERGLISSCHSSLRSWSTIQDRSGEIHGLHCHCQRLPPYFVNQILCKLNNKQNIM